MSVAPIGVRIKFKVILITFKAIDGLVPYYIQSLIEVKEKSSYNLRSNDELLRMKTSLKPFKAKLKTLLFKEAYDL